MRKSERGHEDVERPARCESLGNIYRYLRLTGRLLCIEMPAKMPREWTRRCKPWIKIK